MQLWFFKLEHELGDSTSSGLSPLIIAPRLPLRIFEVSTFENRIAGTGIDKDGKDAICTFTISPDATVEDCRVWRSVIEEDDIHGEPYSSAEEMLHHCACFCMISQHSLILFSGYGYYLVRLSEDVDVPIAQIIWSSATESYFGAETTVLAPRIRHNTILVTVFRGDESEIIEIPFNHLPESGRLYPGQVTVSVDENYTILKSLTPLARETLDLWMQVMLLPPAPRWSEKDWPFSVSIGSKTDTVEVDAILADEWTGKIVISWKLMDFSAEISGTNNGCHILVIDLLKQT
jgi:hypothetical protein